MIADFLLARIAEDEESARAAMSRADARWENESRLGQVWTVANDEGRVIHMPALRSPLGDHIARHDPARVLAECEAKRVWVSEYERWSAAPGPQAPIIWAAMRGPMHHLAAIYADHPDYDESWRH